MEAHIARQQWKSFYLVLRPNLLSLYKSPTEERLLKQITVSDLTAVAYLKDPKGRRDNLFGLYSPSRNWHLQAQSAAEAKAWVELVKHEARIDEAEQEMLLASPTRQKAPITLGNVDRSENDRLGSSSPEPSIRHSTTTPAGIKIPGFRRPSGPSLDYSGDETGPYSDFSDTPPGSLAQQSSNFGKFMDMRQNDQPMSYPTPLHEIQNQTSLARHVSQASGLQLDQQEQQRDNDRVIWHGYLLYLKSKGAVRQWKRTWAVLRPMHLAFYKNNDEYAAKLIIPLSNIINAVEIDPISRSKTACMQIITEARSHRFCAYSEDALAEWLGALKSQLAKKKEKESMVR